MLAVWSLRRRRHRVNKRVAASCFCGLKTPCARCDPIVRMWRQLLGLGAGRLVYTSDVCGSRRPQIATHWRRHTQPIPHHNVRFAKNGAVCFALFSLFFRNAEHTHILEWDSHTRAHVLHSRSTIRTGTHIPTHTHTHKHAHSGSHAHHSKLCVANFTQYISGQESLRVVGVGDYRGGHYEVRVMRVCVDCLR